MTQPIPEPTGATTGEKVTYSLAALEASMAAAVLASYVAWLSLVKDVLFGGDDEDDVASPVNPGGIWTTEGFWRREVDTRIMPKLLDIARIGWDDTMRQLGFSIPFDPTDHFVVDQLNRTRNLLVRTPDEVYRDIIVSLNAAVNAGEDLAQQAARVRNILDTRGVENWPARAKTVSVTEVNRALAFGAYAAGQRLHVTLPTLLKVWDAKLDSATRPEHRAADGQKRPINEPFDVGNFPMVAPLDPFAPPHLVINCRCKLRFELGVHS